MATHRGSLANTLNCSIVCHLPLDDHDPAVELPSADLISVLIFQTKIGDGVAHFVAFLTEFRGVRPCRSLLAVTLWKPGVGYKIRFCASPRFGGGITRNTIFWSERSRKDAAYADL